MHSKICKTPNSRKHFITNSNKGKFIFLNNLNILIFSNNQTKLVFNFLKLTHKTLLLSNPLTLEAINNKIKYNNKFSNNKAIKMEVLGYLVLDNLLISFQFLKNYFKNNHLQCRLNTLFLRDMANNFNNSKM